MATEIRVHDSVVLTVDLPNERLAAGDIGTVVHVHRGGEGYEVEFMTLHRQTVCRLHAHGGPGASGCTKRNRACQTTGSRVIR